MIAGRTLHDFAVEVKRQAESKHDFIVSTNAVSINSAGRLSLGEHGDYDIKEMAHRQISERLQIPAKYYDRIRQDHPILWQSTVNHFFKNEPSKRLVRTLDGSMRAFLSDSYRTLDNEDLVQNLFPVLEEYDGLRIVSCEITDRHLYAQAVYPKNEMEVRKGDVVQSGIVIRNSEVGSGTFAVEPLIFRLVCTNGMISKDFAMRQYHIGKAQGGDVEHVEVFFSDETKELNDRAFFAKAGDLVRGVLAGLVFEALVGKMRTATLEKMPDPLETIEAVANTYQLKDTEKKSVLENLINGSDLTRYGLLNAITKTANTVTDYDRAVELESLGGKILDLSPADWKVITKQ